MKIVNFKELAESPIGTIFCSYEPEIFEGLFIKLRCIYDSDNKPIDFLYIDLSPEYVNDETREFDPGISRWGLFNFENLFAIYEDKEIDLFINLLKTRKQIEI